MSPYVLQNARDRCYENYDRVVSSTEVSPTELLLELDDGTVLIYDDIYNDLYAVDFTTRDGWLREFGRRVRHYATLRGIRQGDLARIIGVTQPLISKYMQGKMMPSAKQAYKLSVALGCTLDYLIGF